MSNTKATDHLNIAGDITVLIDITKNTDSKHVKLNSCTQRKPDRQHPEINTP